MILAGIDEAGYGPVLGPLVVSAAAFEVQEGETDLWKRLKGRVVKTPPRKHSGHVAVADSKKLYNRKKKNGLAPLERGVLTFLGALHSSVPDTLAGLAKVLSPGAENKAAGYPWYGPCSLGVPHHAGRTDIELNSNALRVAMREAGVRIAHMRSEIVLAGEFNRLVAASRNKSVTCLDITCRHLARMLAAWPGKDLQIVVDRQGGRIRYRETLQRVFPRAELKIGEETENRSAYVLKNRSRRVEIVFAVKGETAALATAMASMMSKYLRELFMAVFNGFWAGQVGEIAPTAGYYVDGRRFFRQIGPALEKLGACRESIYRCR